MKSKNQECRCSPLTPTTSAKYCPRNRTVVAFTQLIKDTGDTSDIPNSEIFIINKDGTGQTRLTNKKGFDSGADWSPDGQKIAFYGTTENDYFDIFIMNSNGKNIINITNDTIEDYSPSWSPDGNWITFTSGNPDNYDVWIMNVNTKERRRLTTHPKRNETPFWQPKKK